MAYTLSTTLKQSMPDAIETLKTACMNHKLGIVSDIDVQATIKNKLDEDIAPYRILGACNPGLAKKAIESVPQAGALLPCTVVVREEGDHTAIDFMSPATVLGLEDNETVQAVAKEATSHIQAVIDELNTLS